MSCAAIKHVKGRLVGGTYLARCEGMTASCTMSLERAAKQAAAKAWAATLKNKKITEGNITLSPMSEEGHFYARCFSVRPAAKPLHKRSVKPAATGMKPVPPEGVSQAQIGYAFAACRSIKFAGEDSRRHGNWDLNSIQAAERLALEALGLPQVDGGAL